MAAGTKRNSIRTFKWRLFVSSQVLFKTLKQSGKASAREKGEEWGLGYSAKAISQRSKDRIP